MTAVTEKEAIVYAQLFPREAFAMVRARLIDLKFDDPGFTSALEEILGVTSSICYKLKEIEKPGEPARPF